jgi:hypothetical protein
MELPDDLLFEQALRFHGTMIESVDSLDSKAGSLINVSIVVAGLVAVGGALSLQQVYDPSKEAQEWLYVLLPVLVLGSVLALVSVLVAIVAWRRAEVVVISPSQLTAKYEEKNASELRRFLIVELGAEFDKMGSHRTATLRWLRMGMFFLALSIGMLMLYTVLAFYVVVT